MRNWKILLIIASLSLSASLTSCGKKDKVVSGETQSESATSAATSASEAASKRVDIVECAMKAADGSKVQVLKIPSSLNQADRILVHLDCGNIAFSYPEEMNVGEPETIKLILSGNKSVQAIETALKKDLGKKDRISSNSIRISELMKADLYASESDFKIESLSDKEQAISMINESTEWMWKVTPKKSGKRDIRLSLSAIVKISDRASPLPIETFNKHINVKVSTAKMLSIFLSDNWQWLWTTIFIPLAPFLWNGYQKRKEKTLSTNLHSGDLSG
jgi:hypothetical protein